MPLQKPGRSKQDYSTPTEFITAVKLLLGIEKFSFDFAADRDNAKANAYWDIETDALSQSAANWAINSRKGWGWLNPPYGDIAPWASKCLQALRSGGRIAFLVPASVGSNWFRDYIHDQPDVTTLFLNGRLCFIDDWQHKTYTNRRGEIVSYTSEPLYPKDTMLVLFGQFSDSHDYVSDVWTWK